MKSTLTDIAKCVNGTQIGNAIIENISINSKDMRENCLFIGIKGEKFDGNDFINDAIHNGAKAILTTKDVINAPSIKVLDSNKAFLDLAKGYKLKFKELKTVAVTGSVGKTTTKEMVYSVLNMIGETHKNKGNLNNHIGVPLTLLDLEKKHQYAVIEMGMSNFKEIEALSDMVCPDIAIITNIGVSHIEYLGSREGIRDAKLEVLSGLREILILNADEPLLLDVKTDKKVFYFGIENDRADIKAKNIRMFDDHMIFTAVYGHKYLEVRLNTVGIHNIYNALPAILCGILFEAKDELIIRGLLDFKNASMRQNIYTFNGYYIIDDCYNASSPESMFASLDVLEMKKATKKIAILGAMRELGNFSKDAHKEVLEYALKKADKVLLFGDEWSGLDIKNAQLFNDKNYLIAQLSVDVNKGDAILFKGSRSTKMEEVLKIFTREV